MDAQEAMAIGMARKDRNGIDEIQTQQEKNGNIISCVKLQTAGLKRKIKDGKIGFFAHERRGVD